MITFSIITAIILVLPFSLLYYQPIKAYEVGIGVEFNTHATPVWIALHEELFNKYSIRLSNVLKFQTGLELAAALARGDLQAGWICLGPALVIINKEIPIKIVAKVHNHGYALVVNPKKVEGLKDLEDRVVYSPGKGSPAYLLLLKIEEVHHVKFEKAFMKPQALLSALLTDQIDAAALPEHRVSVAESKGLKVLLRSQDVWPDMPGSYLVVKEDLVKEHPEIVSKLVEINNYGIELINKDLGHAAEVAAEALGIDKDVSKRSISMLKFNDTLDVDEIQKYIDFMHSYGIIKKLNASSIIAPP